MAQTPHADEGRICPLHKLDTSAVCHKCPLWVQLRGKNPQSDAEIDTWACSLALLPVLLLENAQMQRQTGAAVDKLCTQMHEEHKSNLRVLAAGALVRQPMKTVEMLPPFSSKIAAT